MTQPHLATRPTYNKTRPMMRLLARLHIVKKDTYVEASFHLIYNEKRLA